MPVPNELSPEDEALFAAHGVPSAGPGGEPVADPVAAPPAPEPVVHADRDPSTGRFVSRVGEQQPDPNAPPAAPADPNAPPADPNAPAQPVDPNAQPAAPEGFVPHAALHQERQQRQALQAQFQQLQARTNMLLMQRQQAPQNQPQMPDLSADPVAYVQTLERRLAELEATRQASSEDQQTDAMLRSDEQAFVAHTPDYDAASDHYIQSRARELLLMMSPPQAQEIMLNEARQLTREAVQRGMSPAQMIYNLAQARGFVAGQAPVPQVPQQPAPQPAPAAPVADPTLAAIRNAQQVTRSLSNAPANPPAGQVDAAALLSMSDEEFSNYFNLGSKTANANFASVAGR